MKDYLSKLNPKQLLACKDTEGPSLIIAGAGSGKTRVLTTRIAYLIDECGISPSSILAITFTNKASKEMKDRLENLLGIEKANSVTCKTFHSFCAWFLRREITVFSNRKRDFMIIDDDQTEALIKEVMLKMEIDIKITKPKQIANSISLIKSRISSLDDYPNFYREKLEQIMNLYNESLIRNNLLDFDDLNLLTIEILENYPKILDRYQDHFRYILVDEFQDSSNIQYDLVHILGEKYKNVFIVGDEDQSIYSFRGANIKNIKKFMRDFDGYNEHILDQNYRSTKEILNCSNKLISHNKDRIKKDLWTENADGDKLYIFEYDSDKAEARGVVEEITKSIKSGKYEYKDFAVLYRNNFLSRNFENELIAKSVPYKVYNGLSFYKRMEVKDMLGYIRIIINPNDFYSFKRVINSPRRGIGDSTIKKIEKIFDNDGDIKRSIEKADIYQTTRETLKAFMIMIDSLREEIEKLTIRDFFTLVYEKTGYKKFIYEIEDDDERESRKQNVDELLNALSEIESLGSNTETFSDFLENVSLLTDFDVESKDANHVSLITMHSSKGLEYKNVFAVGLEDETIPGSHASEIKEYEEERRLLYVCLTRAMEHLFISYSSSRYKFGQVNPAYPSRFLKELGLEKRTERDKEERSFYLKKDTTPKITGDIKTGERVYHEMYKEGTVLGQIDGFYIIKFDNSVSPKKVIVNHPFLKKL